MKFNARLLPDYKKVIDQHGVQVPLIVEHRIYGDRIGTVFIGDDAHFGIIETDDERCKVGTKLSAGVFVTGLAVHEIREMSITKSPKFPECELIDEIN